MTTDTAATTAHLDRWESLRDRWERAETDARQAGHDMDALLAEMADSTPVAAVAATVGLSRQEVHRRIARHRR